jgi:tetratricopeptide (TPR) repeat protein
VQPAAPDPEVARRAVAQKLAEANVAFEALDWAKAEELLQGARVDGALVPEAQQLLSRLNAEKGFRAALDEAGRLLDQGNDEKAQPLLDSARATRLLGKQLAELTARARKLQGERLDKQKQAAAPKSEPPPGKPSAAAELYNEANDLARRKQYDAAVMRLDRCVKADPAYYNCFKLLGSMHARISARDGSASDQELARKNYERFIELAPPEDEAVPKVRKILDEAP